MCTQSTVYCFTTRWTHWAWNRLRGDVWYLPLQWIRFYSLTHAHQHCNYSDAKIKKCNRNFRTIVTFNLLSLEKFKSNFNYVLVNRNALQWFALSCWGKSTKTHLLLFTQMVRLIGMHLKYLLSPLHLFCSASVASVSYLCITSNEVEFGNKWKSF